jgi:hypothetical protein
VLGELPGAVALGPVADERVVGRHGPGDAHQHTGDERLSHRGGVRAQEAARDLPLIHRQVLGGIRKRGDQRLEA